VSELILIIDDEKFICKQLEKTLSREGYDSLSVHNGGEGIETAMRENPSVVLLDLKLPDMGGLEVLENLTNIELSPATIIMTAHGNVESAVTAIKSGAYDFIEKPFSAEKLKVMVRNAISTIELKRKLNTVTKGERQKYGFESLVGSSKEIQKITYLFKKLSNEDPKTILITGESGTGKGIAARVLHFNGTRAEKPFVELNCAAVPETLLENELFGHEQGAFTDAKKMKQGIFELAHGGTIFLDEIGDMSHALQVKLIKVIEERTFRRLGGTRNITVDVRIIAATNRDLKDLVDKKLFREDLFHRLNVISFVMPPLRERKSDIPPLTDNFVAAFNAELGKKITVIPQEVRDSFSRYHWPGNVRELRSSIERAMLFSEGETLNPKYVQLEGKSDGDINIQNTNHSMTLEIPLDNFSLGEVEDKIIRRALDMNQWNQTRTAKLLGVTREVLRYRMKKMGLLT